MGFLSPSPPPFELEPWQREPHLARLKPLVQDWGANGFGSPSFVYLLYAFKLVVYALGAALAISLTPGLGGLGDFGDWWTQPIVFEKLALWTLLWEILGLGAGSMPLSFRFLPPIGGPLYWLRPGTVRLPPWPDRVPLTRGTRRTALDAGLYAAVLAVGFYLLFRGGVDGAGASAGKMPPLGIAVLLGLLALLGLRDKVSFLGARPEIYATILAVGLFGVEQWIVAWQFVFVFIWWQAAASKLNRHFPFVVSAMISNAPLPPRSIKRKLWRDYPDDMLPSRLSSRLAQLGTVQELGWPLLLLTVDNDVVRTIALAGMVLFHLNITSMFPLAVPLEWNLFMIFGAIFLFGHYGDVPISTLDEPLPIALIALACVALPLLGSLRPDKVSFLPAMRYYAGNWATTQWLFRKGSGAEDRLDERISKPARLVGEQVAEIYDDPELAEFLLNKGLAFRAMHSHGRALNALLPHAVDDVEAYDCREGELISNVVNGWNFGDGHFHGRQLLEAVQERCGFAPGEVRVIELESEPSGGAGRGRQRYRIDDAATGLVEEGSVAVADMVSRQPWLDGGFDFPVAVERRREQAAAPVA
jgi:Transmembrane protein of unknown function (DUF3556)